MSEISSSDCNVLGRFPRASANAWSEVLTEDDRNAYRRVHRALAQIAERAVERFPGRLESVRDPGGFHERSGVRNQRPKDLWCALVNPDSDIYVGMPQIFMIASGRGIELGFGPAIHRRDFSDAGVKKKLRAAVPTLFRLFPAPESQLARATEERLRASGGWWFREKARLAPGGQEFNTFGQFLADLKSPSGMRRGAGAVSRYVPVEALDDPQLSLTRQFIDCSETFLPLMSFISGRYELGADLVAMNNTLAANHSAQNAEQAGAFDPSSQTDGRQKTLAAITQRQGQGPFRLALLEAYGRTCAITGASAVQVLEAAHIFPYDGVQTNHVTNGVLLRSDLHTLFDLGLLKIDDDYTVVVSDLVADPAYRHFQGQQIRLPPDRSSWPSKTALQWHRANVLFGEL